VNRPAKSKADMPPLGIYLHWPFCSAICPYCDFNVHAAHKNTATQEDWLAAYCGELTHAHGLRPHGPVETVFLGGGTPSLMPAELVGDILNHIDALWGLAAQAEISLEANPISAAAPHMQKLRQAGITRLSLGVQAFDDAALRFLGRTHSVADARAAFVDAQRIFDSASFDLIYARPAQSLADWQKELSAALALAPQHMSLYQLTIEPDTPFHARMQQGKLAMPDEEAAADLYEMTQSLCAAAGLPAYEISNHAAPAHICRHNQAIWQGGDYAGIGPGAHGRLTLDGTKHASLAARQPQEWLAACREKGHGWQLTKLPAIEAAEEAVMLGLRLTEGRALTDLAAQGVALDKARILPLQEDGLLMAQPDRLQASEKGRLLLDYILARLLA
jgi:putative oxygen-independent coproporphyrinogen III oxidase